MEDRTDFDTSYDKDEVVIAGLDFGDGDSTVECSYEVDDSGNAMIVGIDCCEHGVTSPTGCDDCYDKKSDSFSIVRSMEKV